MPQSDTYLYNEILSSKTSPFATITTSPPMATVMPLATAATTATAAAPDFVTPPSSTANHENHRSFWLKMDAKAAEKQDEEKVRIVRISSYSISAVTQLQPFLANRAFEYHGKRK